MHNVVFYVQQAPWQEGADGRAHDDVQDDEQFSPHILPVRAEPRSSSRTTTSCSTTSSRFRD